MITQPTPDGSTALLENFRAARYDICIGMAKLMLADEPASVEYLQVLGLSYHYTGEPAKAALVLEGAIALDPKRIELYSNLCSILNRPESLAYACRVGEWAVRLSATNSPAALNNHANALMQFKRYGAALARFEEAISLDPFYLNPLKQGVTLSRALCDFDAQEIWERRLHNVLQRVLANPNSTSTADFINIAYMDAVREMPGDLAFKLRRRISDMIEGTARAAPLALRRLRAPGRVHAPRSAAIRVAYMSANFGDHPIGHVCHRVFAHHDPYAFHSIGISLADRLNEAQPFAKDIAGSFAEFHVVGGAPRAIAERISGIDIDILIYLDGFMNPTGIKALAYRPARIALFWLGHAGTLDMDCIDGTIADTFVARETKSINPVFLMNGCYHCASQRPPRESLGPSPTAEIPSDRFVFGAFNNPEKIDSSTFSLWMMVLRNLPESILWLSNQAGQPELESNLRNFAGRSGVSPDRLFFAPRLPDKSAHLARHDRIDLFLDALTLNASTTALDALSMGTPLLTLPGRRFGSRIAASMLTSLELHELICADPADYVRKASALATDPTALRALRQKTMAAVRQGPLFDSGNFIGRLELLLRDVYSRFHGARP